MTHIFWHLMPVCLRCKVKSFQIWCDVMKMTGILGKRSDPHCHKLSKKKSCPLQRCKQTPRQIFFNVIKVLLNQITFFLFLQTVCSASWHFPSDLSDLLERVLHFGWVFKETVWKLGAVWNKCSQKAFFFVFNTKENERKTFVPQNTCRALAKIFRQK